jgi:hypothetical protein
MGDVRVLHELQEGRFIGVGLVLIGILYLIKPNILRRGIWKETSIFQRRLSPDAYVKYMRLQGVICILGGIAFYVYGVHYFGEWVHYFVE